MVCWGFSWVCGSRVSENFHLNLWLFVVGGFVFESGNFWVRVCGWMVGLKSVWDDFLFWARVLRFWVLV